MKKLQLLIILVVLSGCARFNWNYQPQLATQPKNAEKYEKDRQDCFAELRKIRSAEKQRTRTRNGIAGAGLGMIGITIVESQDPTHPRTPAQMTDECMADKGYDVVKAN